MVEEKKYNFSFTGVTLNTVDFVIVTKHIYIEQLADIDLLFR